MPETRDPCFPQPAMRLGTRSCAECRRRKARCTYPEGSRSCEGCTLRQRPCLAQKPRQQVTRSRLDRDVGSGSEELQQRVQALENVVRQMGRGLDLLSDSPTGGRVSASAMRESQPLQSPQTDDTNPAGSSSAPDLGAMSTADSAWDSDDALDLEDAPLVALLRAATMLEYGTNEGPASSAIWKLSSSSRLDEASSALGSVLLRDQHLRLVLETTHKYWQMWPACHYGHQHMDRLQCVDSSAAMSLLSDMIELGSPSIMAKAALFLSLCIQQLPQNEALSMGLAPKALVTTYMRAAGDLLDIATGIRETIDAAEAWLLESKLYVNMGKPRKAWLSIRRAANASLLLGLHRPDKDGKSRSERETSLWAQIWQNERLCCLMLGLPSAMSNRHPLMSGDPPLPSPDGIYAPLRYRLCVLMGDMIERNHESPPNYLSTVKIDQDLEQCRMLMPDDFWTQLPSLDRPLIDIYACQLTKIVYFLCVMMLHMPLMLKASTHKRYEHSRASAQDAARGVITNYLLLRQAADAEYIICELLDFQVFSAGMILMVNLLRHPHHLSTQESRVEDLRLLEALAEALNRTASSMHCDVARQGSHVLTLLLHVQRGSNAAGLDTFVAVMPYFGRVKISFPIKGIAATTTTEDANTSLANPPHITTTGSVQFSGWSDDQDFAMTTDFDEELVGDWSAVMGTDIDLDYDWAHFFDGH